MFVFNNAVIIFCSFPGKRELSCVMGTETYLGRTKVGGGQRIFRDHIKKSKCRLKIMLPKEPVPRQRIEH
jgi:hypothetical protein